MSKVLNREQSGNFAESLVFYELLSLGHVVKFATKNQCGYDLTIEKLATTSQDDLNLSIKNQNKIIKKIEVKHIQYTGNSSSDSFKLSKDQAKINAFDILILVVSDCKTKQHISKIDFFIFTNNEINLIVAEKNSVRKNQKSNITRDYTFNLNNSGTLLASFPLENYLNQWQKL